MFCPSCENNMPDNTSYCGRCGMFLNAKSIWLMHASINIGWILRRSLGGFAAGAVSWIFAMAVVRTIGMNAGPGFNSFLLCVISGIFLGTVGGILEDSSYKAFIGGMFGCIGGIVGGMIAKFVVVVFELAPLSTISFLPAYMVVGMAIGAVSPIFERSAKKIVIGMLGGMVAGGFGGFMGVEMYGALVTDFLKEGASWFAGRSVEAFAGGVLGSALWLVIGTIEKLFIFKRRFDSKIDKKTCDQCLTQNELYHWYCVKCGAILQVAAPREKIRITPLRALERIINAFKFLSWLFGAAGIITTVFIFLVVLFKNPVFALLGGLSVGLLSYSGVILFGFFANMLSSVVKITDTMDRPPAR